MAFTAPPAEKVESLSLRLGDFAGETKDAVLSDLAERLGSLSGKDRDLLSTRLMGAFRDTSSNQAFSLLYELNQDGVLRLIYHHLRRSFYQVDASDVLQEVFFNIFRYPSNFDDSRPSAFRNWTHSIIRNTVLKHSRKAQRNRTLPLGLPDPTQEGSPRMEPVDEGALSPFDESAAHEADEELRAAWSLYLHFYLYAYRCLTPREKRALYLVEAEGLPYKEAAADLDVRVENLKMRIFRARRKIFTIMKRKFNEGQGLIDRRNLRRAMREEEMA